MYMLARNKMQKICVFAFMTVVCSGSPPLLEAQESSPHFFTTREMQRKDDSYYTYDSQEKISLAKILHIASSPDEEQAPVVILPTLVIVQETGFMHVLLVLTVVQIMFCLHRRSSSSISSHDSSIVVHAEPVAIERSTKEHKLSEALPV